MATGDIPKRALGKTGVMVSALGMGGHHLGELPSQTEATALVHAAIDGGIDFFDNCWEYHLGKSEEYLGNALVGKRDKVFLMTKVCTHGRGADLATKMLEQSLRRLRTDHLDLWQIHGVTFDNDPELAYRKGGVLEAMEKAKKEGKVRFLGFTGHKDPSIHLEMITRGFPFDAAQMPLNCFDASFRSFASLVVPEARKRGIGVLGMKSLGGTAAMVTKGAVSPEEAIRYAMSLPVTTTICGMESKERLQQNLAIARAFTPMSEDEMGKLRDRCRPHAKDGRYELYKVSLKYDNPEARLAHDFPLDKKQKEVKEMLDEK